MQYHTYEPRPPLGAFIERFWSCSDAPAHPRERILPTGTFELVIDLAGDRVRIFSEAGGVRCYSGAVVSGAYERFFAIDPVQHTSIVGVHFRPGGAAAFLDFPPGELGGAHVDLARAGQLRERLCAADTAEARFAILEEELRCRFRPRERHAAVATALDAFREPSTRVRDVVREVGLSHRRFVELFTREVGTTPKVYARIQRFHRARAMARSAAPDWARIAVACGYFDQAHLHRDFEAFAGLTPSAYARQQSEGVLPNHVPQGQLFPSAAPDPAAR